MKGISGHMGLIKLAALMLLLPLSVYQWGFRPTVELHGTVREQTRLIGSAQTQADEAVRTDLTPLLQTQENEPVDTLSTSSSEATLRYTKMDGESVKSGTVLHHIAPWLDEYGVTAERYTPYRLYAEGGSELYAGELILSGGFIPLTRLIDRLETDTDARIVSLSYQSVTHPQSRKTQLQMTVVFQQITQNDTP